jgi:molecular chaperone DnaK
VFSTAADNQTSVEIHIVQGERAMAQDNKSLGRFILDGIPPAPRGMPQIEVTFDVDANGILAVKAKDKATGKEQSIRIEARSGLSQADIEKMQKEAEMHANEDAKKKEVVEAKNIAEQLIYTAEKSLKDAGDKVPADIKTGIESKITDLKKEKDTDNLEQIKKATEALSSEVSKIGEFMNKQASESGQSAGSTPESGAKEAEFEEKKDEETK